MDNPKGKIQSLISDANGTRAVIGVDVTAACPRCAAGKGCGAGFMSGGSRERQVEASIPAGLELAEGDVVEIALAPHNLLRAALIVYGLPLLGAAIAAALAYGLAMGDVAAAVAALAGLAAGLIVGHWRLRQEACLRRFVPTIERTLPDSQAGT